MEYYAIAKGKKTGIFANWNSCKTYIDGYKGAIFKKFDNKKDAILFIKKNNSQKNNSQKNNSKSIQKDISSYFNISNKTIAGFSSYSKKLDKSSEISEINEINEISEISEINETIEYIYTDGGCINNGKPNAIAGIGIYFGENDPRNVSKRLMGQQTNNIAELTALIVAYQIIKNDTLDNINKIKFNKNITIFTDSEYAIKCATTYGDKNNKTNWTIDIPNKELVKQLYQLYKTTLPDIKLKFIRSHTGYKDKHSLGNEKADELASISIGNNNKNNNYKKIYLNVPFVKKNEAKAQGAKWDRKAKKWYIMDNSSKKEILIKTYGIL